MADDRTEAATRALMESPYALVYALSPGAARLFARIALAAADAVTATQEAE